ncbi:hypothetical protein [Streptomyces sp. NRRL WC-3742]|uniref:hypothetical protein n=1 Tax=Streptomyces sp. NRRL WC-3742 TaxID=1463934 RepID=UPI000690883C|nr:hypothetical protein [Streptomyces sp. NRRL WC-3742]
MPQFTDGTLAVVDDVHDRERASNGDSRYGAYLARNKRLLHEDGQPLTAAEFACSAWQIATSPVMSPGYVRIRPDLHAVTVVPAAHNEVALRVEVPLRHSALAHRPDHRLGDWQPDPWGTERGFGRLIEPYADKALLLATATLLLPVPDHLLIEPGTAEPGPIMTIEAKSVVEELAVWANAHAHLVNDLSGGGR